MAKQPQDDLLQIANDADFAKELEKEENKGLVIEKAPDRKPAMEDDGLNFEIVTKKKGCKSPQKVKIQQKNQVKEAQGPSIKYNFKVNTTGV